MQTTMLSVIPLTLLLFNFGAAVVPPNPDNRLPLLKGNPDRLHDIQKFVETGYCKKGRDASQCILKGRNVNQNGWEICDTDKPRLEHTAKDAIERWIDNVSTELQSSSTTSANDKRAGQSWLDDIQATAQRKRNYPGPFRDDISLAPSFTQPTSSRRSFSPTRVKAQLATATPKVVFVHGSTDPGCMEAKSLLSFLTSEDSSPWQANTDVARKISSASSRCATESATFLWNLGTESVVPKYLPRYTAKNTFNRKIDLVVGLPKEAWKEKYKRVGIDIFGRDLSHVDHPHTGKRLLGLGVEVKPLDGNLIVAHVQLAVWMAGLMSWASFSQYRGASSVSPPPTVGCTVIGYIIYGVVSTSSQLSEVRVWGPFSALEGQTMDEYGVTVLASRLHRVMQYICTTYTGQLLSTTASSYSQ
ncbi:hypothetical protein BDV30DRAFT_238133 [Aspergillus minisclerotigenes]|uniref:PD-(D/E)XK nuclease-like domain-containing protein n=1 Tax=Aspergillus minisclerotigenes TaxID=656917 RepID=A0A5N6J5D7_9EURO|nr:hypothetical protein BDV30DRAFT_238133 [Aspergillus minisclerotigenes]